MPHEFSSPSSLKSASKRSSFLPGLSESENTINSSVNNSIEFTKRRNVRRLLNASF